MFDLWLWVYLSWVCVWSADCDLCFLINAGLVFNCECVFARFVGAGLFPGVFVVWVNVGLDFASMGLLCVVYVCFFRVYCWVFWVFFLFALHRFG